MAETKTVFCTENQAWLCLEKFFAGDEHDVCNKSDEEHEQAQDAFRTITTPERTELTPELKADWTILKSRLEAYMATCHKQGSKLSRIEKILVEASREGKVGLRINELCIGHVHFETNSTLEQLAEVLREKGSNR